MLGMTQQLVTQHKSSDAGAIQCAFRMEGAKDLTRTICVRTERKKMHANMNEEYAVRRLDHAQENQTFRMQSTKPYLFGTVPNYLVQYQSKLVWYQSSLVREVSRNG